MQDFLFEKKKEKKQNLHLTQEETDNLVGFFDLLIKVDKRINPELYKKKNDRQRGNTTK